MKKVFLILVICLISLSSKFSFSQVNKSILDTTKQWNVLHTFTGTQEFKKFTNLYRISSEDTIIDNKAYLKLLKATDYDTSLAINWQTNNWIREDSNKVYIFTYSNTSCNGITYYSPREYILFDFNLSLNDTFHITYEEYELHLEPLVVSQIDSIEVDNQYCKRIIFNGADPLNPQWGVYWIEGIGSNGDFINQNDDLSHSIWNLLCTYKNNNLIYDAGYGYCYTRLETKEIEQDNNQITVYPTLIDKEINISSDKYPISLSVIDLFGREVLRKEIYNNRTIDLDFLKKDTYILKLKHKDTIINRKIIKK